MNLKKVKIINVILMFLLSFLFHFVYDWLPNFVTSIFFPVNESIWEHMKIIYGVVIVVSFLQIIICKYKDISLNNRFFEMLFKAVFGIIFYLVIFIPLYLLFGENMIISIGLMLFIYIVIEVLGYKILMFRDLGYDKISILLLILGYVIFGILTYYPIHSFMFRDEKKMAYGIINK